MVVFVQGEDIWVVVWAGDEDILVGVLVEG